jgi:cell division protein FtsL
MNKINLTPIQKFYLINSTLFIGVLMSIYMMFYVQFKVSNLQDQANQVNRVITTYEDEIKILEVEWVYLTRPERIRTLAEKYLQNNSHIASNQVKEISKLQPYYTANMEKYESRQVAMQEEAFRQTAAN